MFLAEKEEREREFARLKQQAQAEHDQRITIEYFEEDWQHSQFWYSDETALTLGNELIRGIAERDEDVYVAIVAAPSAFIKLMEDRVCDLYGFLLVPRLIGYRAPFQKTSSYICWSSIDDLMFSESNLSITISKSLSTSLAT